MKQLILFPMTTEAQSLGITAKASLENNLISPDSITASSRIFEDDINIFRFNNEEDPENWGDIYDEYEDFDQCSRTWH